MTPDRSASPASDPGHHHHPRKCRRVPGNTYYYMPYYAHFFCIYTFAGSFGCSWFGEYLSFAEAAILWTVYVVSLLLLMLLSPTLYVERKKTDEEGRDITLRCQLVGLKACEVDLDVEGIEKGLYDPPDGNVHPGLHDGCRHGPALFRI